MTPRDVSALVSRLMARVARGESAVKVLPRQGYFCSWSDGTADTEFEVDGIKVCVFNDMGYFDYVDNVTVEGVLYDVPVGADDEPTVPDEAQEAFVAAWDKQGPTACAGGRWE